MRRRKRISGNRFGASVRASPLRIGTQWLDRAELLAAPSPIAKWSPKSANYVMQITDGRGAASYIGDNRHTRWKKGKHVMTWTSDRAGVVFYTVLGMLIVLSSIYIPA
jgi:hypothetical protein